MKVEAPNTSNHLIKTPLKALPGPQPVKSAPQTDGKKVQCFKCKGYGHYARECVNQRVMIIGHDGNIYSEDEEQTGVEGDGELCPNSNIGLSSKDELVKRMNNLVVLRMLSVQPKQEEYMEQRTNIFNMNCKILAKMSLVIIDEGSCTNMASDKLLTKLGLEVLKHPSP